MMLADLRTLILGDATIAALLGNRLHYVEIPQNSVYPAAVYRRISQVPQNTHDTTSGTDAGLHFARVQFDLYADTPAELIALSSAFEIFLNGLSATQDDTDFQSIAWESDGDNKEPVVDKHRELFDILIWYKNL